MAKRFVSNQQHGERKKAKLDITISDHNFPLSQNNANRDVEQDNWGDDNDDEILLLASQACEQAYNNDASLLPDYSMCMQPASTSTQYEPAPSTSKSAFTFKKPSANAPSAVSTHLKNKFSTISSPLPGMSTKVSSKPTDNVPMNDDLVFNDKICKGQDPDFMYRQLLQLQEENAKLKSENGKLLEKCVTKEGEASILRTQLKSCQVAVDNARMEKIKAQEKVQMEWTEKLAVANSQMHDLRTQLDFKNLEIISIKEKCKKLESTKLKLTQVTLANNDASTSHRNNSIAHHESFSQAKRVKQSSSAVQTENNITFLKLNKIYRKEFSKLTSILPLILEPTSPQHSLLDYNEKLQRHTEFTRNKCQIYSTFQWIPSTPSSSKEDSKNRVTISSMYEDLTHIAADDVTKEELRQRHFNLFSALNSFFLEVKCELEMISSRVNNAFQKEMDEKYIEATATFLVVEKQHLLLGRPLFKDEQAISARRATAAIALVLESSESLEMFQKFQVQCRKENSSKTETIPILKDINRICSLLDSTSCAILYSGLLQSITILLQNILKLTTDRQLLETIKVILSSRPMPFVSCQILSLIRKISENNNILTYLCPKNGTGNLKVDYDQGVLLYRKDSCHLQVALKQVEWSLKCIERQRCTDAAVSVARHLIALCGHLDTDCSDDEVARCDCQLVLTQVMVYALRICAVMLKTEGAELNGSQESLVSVCRSGVQALYRGCVRPPAPAPRPHPATHEGLLLHTCEILARYDHGEIYDSMLTELMSTFQATPEDMPSSFPSQPWLRSFETFSITD